MRASYSHRINHLPIHTWYSQKKNSPIYWDNSGSRSHHSWKNPILGICRCTILIDLESRHPFDSCGSGSTCAIAPYERLDFIVGSDTRGSIQKQAALVRAHEFCPSHGSMNLTGVVLLSEELDFLHAHNNLTNNIYCKFGSGLCSPWTWTEPAECVQRHLVLCLMVWLNWSCGPVQHSPKLVLELDWTKSQQH